jgi:hypothetical protein
MGNDWAEEKAQGIAHKSGRNFKDYRQHAELHKEIAGALREAEERGAATAREKCARLADIVAEEAEAAMPEQQNEVAAHLSIKAKTARKLAGWFREQSRHFATGGVERG